MTGKDVIEPLELPAVKGNVERTEGGIELVLGARPHYWCGHGGLVQQPRQGELPGFPSQLVGEFLVLPDLVLLCPEGLQGAAGGAADPLALLLQHSAEQPAMQR